MILPGMLLAASLLLVCFAAVGVLLLRADTQARRIREHQVLVVAGHLLASAPRPLRRRLAQALRTGPLRQAFSRLIGMDPGRVEPYSLRPWLVVPLAAIGGCAVRWLLHGVLGGLAWLLVPVAAALIARSVYHADDARRVARIYRQFPDALAMIVRAVRVGIPVTEALWAVSRNAEQPTAGLFGRLCDQVGIGTPLEDALSDMATRTHVPEYRFFSAAISLQSQTGGGLTETLENLADVIRKRVALKARGLALAAEARTSAAVLAVLPMLAGCALAVLDPAYLAPLFEEKQGQALLGCTVVWLGLGLLTMRGLIRKSLS